MGWSWAAHLGGGDGLPALAQLRAGALALPLERLQAVSRVDVLPVGARAGLILGDPAQHFVAAIQQLAQAAESEAAEDAVQHLPAREKRGTVEMIGARGAGGRALQLGRNGFGPLHR